MASSWEEKFTIPYMEMEAFDLMYPIGKNRLGKGTYGKVYQSKDNCAVKIIKDNIYSFMLEMHIYNMIKHDCIMRPLAWSFKKNKGYIAMPKAKCIYSAYEEKLITLEQIIVDVLSAIAYLNSIGYAHCDIKLQNILYYNGRAQFIDMGMAKKAVLYKDGENSKYYFSGVAYSGSYRDPEYIYFGWNNINSELYAIGVFLFCLLNKKTLPPFNVAYSFRTGHSLVDNIIAKSHLLQNKRLSVKEVLDELPNELHHRIPTGITYEEIKPPHICGGNCNIRRELYSWIVNIASIANSQTETLFLALSLAYRCYPNPLVVNTGIFIDKNKVNFFGLMCLDIATHILDDNLLDLAEWLPQLNNVYTLSDCDIMAVNIMYITNCVINTVTYWNYAKSKEDLIPLLADIFNCRYNPAQIREVKSGSNKNVRMDKIMPAFIQYKKDWSPEEEIPFHGECQINPCDLFSPISMPAFLNILPKLINGENFVPFVFHNRHILPSLPLETAQDIYSLLYNIKDGCDPVLNVICQFNWKRYPITAITQNSIHPFIFTVKSPTK